MSAIVQGVSVPRVAATTITGERFYVRIAAACLMIAVVGFALSAYPVGVEHGWIDRADAAARTLTTLRFFADSDQSGAPSATGHRGFYFHFLDMHSGTRVWRSEVSLIDTALLMAGVLTAAAYFTAATAAETELRRLADVLYRRVDWRWAQHDGTAVMHGGASAGFAVVSLAILERDERRGYVALLPGFTVAVLLHAAFNRMSHQPVIATAAVLVAVPALVLLAYHHGERTLAEWLGHGFDADAERLALMRSGGLAASPTGRYLSGLKTRFPGPVMADLLGYLRLFTELSLRAKGMLLMRENGFEAEIDEETRGQLEELGYLERSIGVTGLLALHPLLPMRRKALRQLYLM